MPENLLNILPTVFNQLLMALLMILYLALGVVFSLISDVIGNKSNPIDIVLRILFCPANLVFNILVTLFIR
jgi:hypothetical protein